MAKDKGQKRFKGQREKEALVKGLLLSFREAMRVEKPPFSQFVSQCEKRMAWAREARRLAARRWAMSLRWGLALAGVLILGVFVGRGIVFLSAKKDFVAAQMGKVKMAKGSSLYVSRYQRDVLTVVHFVLSSGEAKFEPEKLPGDVRYIVETPHLYIRVVGTVFRVRVDAETTFVKVEEGKVWCYPREKGYTLETVLQGDTPNQGVAVVSGGGEHVWKENKKVAKGTLKTNEQIIPQKLGITQKSSPGIFSDRGEKVSFLFYQEYKNYRVRLTADQKLEILPLDKGKGVSIDLSVWARQWFMPVLFDDSVVMVSYTGIILRFRYDGRILFKLRPVDGTVLGEPLVTSRGVILMQSEGLTVCLWEGIFWSLPAEANFLVRSRPYYDEKRDVLVYANEAGSIAGYSIGRREVLWTHRLVREFVGAPIRGRDGIAYIYGGNGNTLIAVDVMDGHFVWSVSLEAPLQKMDTVGDTLGLVLVSSQGSYVQLFSLREGERVTTFLLPGAIKTSLQQKRMWYLLTEEGEVYGLDTDEKRLHLLTKVHDVMGLTFVSNRLATVGASGLRFIEK
ncbi:MAG: FecR domain-containing protein [Brevinematales bacterium]